MAFLDKIGGIAKNLGDKANSAIETTKLNSKINTERASITECMRKIGEYYYGKYQAGDPGDPGVAELLATIDSHNQAIAEAQAEIARIQAESAAPPPAAQGGAYAPPPIEGGVVCPSCGLVNPPGTRFCSGCGTKIEPPAPPEPVAAPEPMAPPEPVAAYEAPVVPEVSAVPETRVCPGCGAQVALTAKFCGDCGYRFEG